jgi:hypothetical protein
MFRSFVQSSPVPAVNHPILLRWYQPIPISKRHHVAGEWDEKRRCRDRVNRLVPPADSRNAPRRQKQEASLSSHVATFFLSWKNLGHLVVAYLYTGTVCLDVITRHCPPILPLIQPGSITFPSIWIQIRTIYYTSFQYHPSQWRGHNPRRRASSSKQDTGMSGRPGFLAICPAHGRAGQLCRPRFPTSTRRRWWDFGCRRVLCPFLSGTAFMAVVTIKKTPIVHAPSSTSCDCRDML